MNRLTAKGELNDYLIEATLKEKKKKKRNNERGKQSCKQGYGTKIQETSTPLRGCRGDQVENLPGVDAAAVGTLDVAGGSRHSESVRALDVHIRIHQEHLGGRSSALPAVVHAGLRVGAVTARVRGVVAVVAAAPDGAGVPAAAAAGSAGGVLMAEFVSEAGVTGLVLACLECVVCRRRHCWFDPYPEEAVRHI